MSKTVIGIISVIVGIALGFLFAVRSFRYEPQVDYDSGSLRNAMYVGPFMVRTEPHCASYFGALRLSNGSEALTGCPQWNVAHSFRGQSRVSGSTIAGMIANEIVGIDNVLKAVPSAKAQDIKQTFLKKLNSEGDESALAYLRNASLTLLDEVARQYGH